MTAISEDQRRRRIHAKIREVNELLHRMGSLIGEFSALGVDAAFKYTPGDDGYGGELEFVHSINPNFTVHEDAADEAAAQADARDMLASIQAQGNA